MRIQVRNIGVLHEATVEIRGITVIAGENNTGKSTVGKSLFLLFNTLRHLDDRIRAARLSLVERQLANFVSRNQRLVFARALDLSSDAQRLAEAAGQSGKAAVEAAVQNWLKARHQTVKPKEVSALVDGVASVLLYQDEDIRRGVVQQDLVSEFGSRFCNVNYAKEVSELVMTVRGAATIVRVSQDLVERIDGAHSMDSLPVYIDDAASVALDVCGHNIRAVDVFQERTRQVVEQLLRRTVNSVESVIGGELKRQQIGPILKRLEEICGGRLVEKDMALMYRADHSEVFYPTSSLSAGLKVFLMLQELIENGAISENGTVVLDEPEIHLHPEWQVALAEMLVLLQKAFSLHLLVTTHSTYFVGALDVYAKKYGVIDDNRYYFAERCGEACTLRDVTKNLWVIYDSLSEPCQTIENVAMEVRDARS